MVGELEMRRREIAVEDLPAVLAAERIHAGEIVQLGLRPGGLALGLLPHRAVPPRVRIPVSYDGVGSFLTSLVQPRGLRDLVLFEGTRDLVGSQLPIFDIVRALCSVRDPHRPDSPVLDLYVPYPLDVPIAQYVMDPAFPMHGVWPIGETGTRGVWSVRFEPTTRRFFALQASPASSTTQLVALAEESAYEDATAFEGDDAWTAVVTLPRSAVRLSRPIRAGHDVGFVVGFSDSTERLVRIEIGPVSYRARTDPPTRPVNPSERRLAIGSVPPPSGGADQGFARVVDDGRGGVSVEIESEPPPSGPRGR